MCRGCTGHLVPVKRESLSRLQGQTAKNKPKQTHKQPTHQTNPKRASIPALPKSGQSSSYRLRGHPRYLLCSPSVATCPCWKFSAQWERLPGKLVANCELLSHPHLSRALKVRFGDVSHSVEAPGCVAFGARVFAEVARWRR